MAEPIPGALLSAGTAGGRSNPQITLHELSIGRIAEISSWPDRLEATATGLAEQAGLPLPKRPGLFAARPGVIVCWLGFGRFLFVAGEDEKELELPGELAAIVDLNEARHAFRIEGVRAANVLNKAVAINFAADVFPAGSLAQTTVHHCPLLILRRSRDIFDLLAPSSLAEAFVDWLKDACMEYGYRIGPLAILTEDHAAF